jgi:hypothetical protein
VHEKRIPQPSAYYKAAQALKKQLSFRLQTQLLCGKIVKVDIRFDYNKLFYEKGAIEL